ELPDAELLRAYLLARDAYQSAKGVASPKLVELRATLLRRAFPNALSEPAPVAAAAVLLLLYLVSFGAIGVGYIALARSGNHAPELAEAEDHYRAGDIVAAIITAKQAVDSDPSNPAAHAALSLYLYEANSHDEAAEHARRAIELQSRDRRPYFVLGSIACDAKDLAGARAQLEALRAQPRLRAARHHEAALRMRIRALEGPAQPPGPDAPPNEQ
ncbi:MAG: hypothetical protein NTW87_32695, partial [Planctomycetota bacterium]|nr:hypothetical protein [Planctomycetota bacterium]